MSLIERFSTWVYGPRRPIIEAFKSLDASVDKGFFTRGSSVQPTGLTGYYTWYTTDGVVFASLNGLSEAAVGQGYHNTFEEDEEAKTLADEFGEAMNLDALLPNITKNMLIAGFCPVETQIDESPSKCALKIIHPKTITKIELDAASPFGIDFIVQEVGSKRPVEIPGEELTWFVHNQIANDKRGVSLIKPVESLLATKQTAVSNMDKIIARRLAPDILWKSRRNIGGLKQAVTEREADEDIFLGNLTEDEMKDVAQIVEVKGDVQFWTYIEYIDVLIFRGLWAPDQYYYRQATEASAKVLKELTDRNINAIQRNVKRGMEAGFYARLMMENGIDEVPRVVWGIERTGVEDLQMESIISTAIEVGMIGPDQLTKLLNMMGLNIGELGWGELPEEEPKEAPEEEPEEKPEDEVPEEEEKLREYSEFNLKGE